ncbi:kinase-like domain-containing protein [Rhizophagus irregularis DAOM 181602=DAOM 197198]|nr:kinase-like domain-containing protein [Rhizophagus irregularis DAOM 181602=DAOM 197198]
MSTIVEVAVQFLRQYNKKICSKMVDRIQIAETAVRILKIHKEEHKDFFSEDNYNNLRKLVDVMRVMKKFIEEVSLSTKLSKFVQAKNIKRVFINLNKKLDSTIKILEFDFMVYFNARADNDNKKIMADIEGLFKYFKIIEAGLTDMSKNLSKVFGQLSILINTENQMITDQKSSKQSENSVPVTLEDIKVSLIEELSKILKKRVNTYQTAEHIERICDVMLDRVQLAGIVIENIENLKNRKENQVNPFMLMRLRRELLV